MSQLPQYYLLLSEDEKRNYVAMLVSKGCMQQWVSEEASRMGLNFLSEYRKASENGELL